jgi:hypothetical protein
MSNLSKAERDKLPASEFADETRRLFPILDQADVDSAAHLIGKAKDPEAVKARISAIAKRKGLKIPDAWQSSKMAAEFAVETSARRVDGDYAIYPNALLFEAGSYPDKSFEMSPEELWAAVEQFRPVGGNIEHTDFLAGRACEVRSIRLDEADPFTLRGEVAVPVWLDENISDRERRLSCEWDRATKTLSGIGLVVNPRVETASLMSAYADFAAKRHDTPHGQMALQMLHDQAARSGAVCSQSNAKMASRHENAAIQAVHDTAVSHGAKCAAMPSGADGPVYPMFGAGSTATATPAPKKEGKRMGNFERFMAWLAADNAAAEAVTEGAAVAGAAAMAGGSQAQPAPAAAAADPEAARMASDLAAMRAENQRLRMAAVTRDAEIFADEQIRDGRAMPSERAAIVDAFTQASIDDGVIGAVTFADGRKTSRIEIVKRQYADRQSVRALFQEAVGDDVLMALHNRAAPKKGDEAPSRAEVDKLLSMTALGRTVLDAKNGASAN